MPEQKSNENIIIRQIPKKLTGTFWGIATFFNPQKYKNKLKNYKIFMESSKKQGLNLITVELAFNNSEFELNEKDADILIQVRSNSIMWQRERLLNIGLENLPKDCDKFAWLDIDIVFTNDNWVNETCGLLEQYKVVQLFQYIVRLNKDEQSITTDRLRNIKKEIGKVYKILNPHLKETSEINGGAWAFRKDIFKTGGFYDKAVAGSADSIMHNTFCNLGVDPKENPYKLFPEELNKDILKWHDKMCNKDNSFYYTDGYIVHLYHGNKKNRLYQLRYKVIHEQKFDPNRDIALNNYSCWEWTTNKPRLHRWLKKYFWIRDEEASGRLIIDRYYSISRYIKFYNYTARVKQYLLLELYRLIGKIGIFIKKHNIRIYYKLKKIIP